MPPDPNLYDAEFFEGNVGASKRSAEVVVPLVIEAVGPRRVVDVGCGAGAWLATFQHLGVDEVWGIDSHEVDPRTLLVPADRFLKLDLAKPVPLGLSPEFPAGFDLALCLEVGEHLPPEAAGQLVDTLTELSPVVLFSAAIPRQGGIGHLNEQWPDFWADLFRRRGHVPIDYLRKRVWNRVERWYAQNILFFVAEQTLHRYPRLRDDDAYGGPTPLSVVHPEHYRIMLEHHDHQKARLERRLADVREDRDRLKQERRDLARQAKATPCRPSRGKTRPWRGLGSGFLVRSVRSIGRRFPKRRGR
jgi:SAM-dependent methyltransferase